MHATLSSKWSFLALFLATLLLAGCGVTTKKTFLDEPVQETIGNAVPISGKTSEQYSSEQLSQNPALNQGEKTGMQKLLNVLTPYRINIQQGNFVSQEMLSRVQPGMTKEQVRFALGTPLLTDIFHAGRWDYIFRLQKPSGEITNNRVIVYFDDNRVARIVNDPLPNETQYLDTVAGPAKKLEVEKDHEKTVEEDTTEKTDSSSLDEPITSSVEEATVTETTPVSQEVQTEMTQPAMAEPVEETSPSYETPSSVTTEDSEVVAPVIVAPPVSAEPAYSQPAMTQTPDRQSYQTDTEPSMPEQREIEQDSVPTDSYESEPVSTDTADTAETIKTTPDPISAEVESAPVYTPQPTREDIPQRATTIQDVSEEAEDDFKAAPNSTMQLHELMQPQ